MFSSTRFFAIILLVGVFAVSGTAIEHIDFRNLTTGENAPVMNDNTLSFHAGKNHAAGAAVPYRFDFSNGVRFDFEYKFTGNQAVPYARILGAGPLSVQLHDEAGKQIKIFYNPQQTNYCQAVVKTDGEINQWHRAAAIFDPMNRMLFLQVNNEKPVTAKFEKVPNALQNVELLLGADRLGNSSRGFTGQLRNLTVTTPYRLDEEISAAAVKPDTRMINGEPVLYRKVTAAVGRHYAFPGIIRLADGRLAAAFREGDEHVCPYGRLMIAWSADNGENWSVPQVVFDSPNDDRDPALLQLTDGTLILSGFRHGGWMRIPQYAAAASYAKRGYDGGLSQIENFLLFSHDRGKTWNKPISIPGFTPHGPVVSNGKLLIPHAKNAGGRRQVHIYRGNLDGSGWERIGCAADVPANSSHGLDEPNLLCLKNGEILCAVRTTYSDGFMYLSRSLDGGKTWGALEKTPVRGFPQHLLEMGDGRILATYGYRYEPQGIRACISRDRGKTWDIGHEMIIRDDANSLDIGYPVSIELNDGRVMTIYYYSSSDHSKPFIETAVFRP